MIKYKYILITGIRFIQQVTYQHQVKNAMFFKLLFHYPDRKCKLKRRNSSRVARIYNGLFSYFGCWYVLIPIRYPYFPISIPPSGERNLHLNQRNGMHANVKELPQTNRERILDLHHLVMAERAIADDVRVIVEFVNKVIRNIKTTTLPRGLYSFT